MNEFSFNPSTIEKGKNLISQACVHEIIFSEGTYQVEVFSPEEKETFWPFIQLDESGKITDCFCSCDAGERKGGCLHLAAAYLEIYKQFSIPLHKRFKMSLWNALMQMTAKRHGYNVDCLKKDKQGAYFAQSLHKKRLFMILGTSKKGDKKLDEILHHRILETEETSLKFSNLSVEDLALWKEGKPSHQLQYELSFWSDLAKWLMSMEENKEPFQLHFLPEGGALPKEIQVSFKDVRVAFYVAEVNWADILPSLDRMGSPIPIYEYQDLIFDTITYDNNLREFHLFTHTLEGKKGELFKTVDPSQIIDLGNWLFHKEIGFYAKHVDIFLRKKIIDAEGVSKMLVKYSRLLEKFLENVSIDFSFYPLNYELFFDDEHRLHIASFLFEKKDLLLPTTAIYEGWVYIEGKGFFQLRNPVFHEIEKIILRKDLSEFITKYKVWLNQYEGFQTHLTHIEYSLSYYVDTWNRLVFKNASGQVDETAGMLDLQDWVYIEGRGFYPKASSKAQQVITPNLVVSKEDVSSFIKSNEEDLETLPGFFNLKQPVEKLGLEVFLNKERRITVKPKVSLKKGYDLGKVRFFGDFSYVEREGFSSLPKGGRIPEIYEVERILSEDEEEDFIFDQLPQLKPLLLHCDSELKEPRQLRLKLHRLIQEDGEEKKQWLFDLSYLSEHGEISLFDVWKDFRERKKCIKTAAGLLLFDESRFSWLKEIKFEHFTENKQIKLSSLEWIRLSLLETIEPPSDQDQGQEQTLRFIEEMKKLEVGESFSLHGLQSNLRVYQEKGVRWLFFLYTYGLSGLLCDEMGLGKTHQAMGLLAACRNRGDQPKSYYLVVCPTSVIYHWEDLLKRFLPTAKVFIYYGVQRTLEGFAETGEILLTSYGTLRSEREALSAYGFEVAIFDEMHMAKNAHSQTHKALKAINARMKLGLTGTPIENRLLELHALFDIILPSYLPRESTYKELFVNPIEKHQDSEKKKLLGKLIHPFTLRRKKEEVLQELPEKIEEIAYVDLSDEQKVMYKQLVKQRKQEILRDLEQEEGKKVPYMHIFALFNALKQVCNHPALINLDIENFQRYKSGKWDLFIELLEEALESGQKVVIFSQYLKMLDMIEKHLKERFIGFAQIRGSTRNRREMMLRFKEDPQCKVFLGSLQAAGVGIDLVSASVVIHYDRWWNPAKENQATDRVHRLGQNRGVQIFKLVCKDTIEEHISQMIQKKSLLLKEVVAYDDQDQIKQLNREELISLLKKIEIK